MLFTFQYGSIKAQRAARRRVARRSLHSNMDRLKPYAIFNISITVECLHSNMDRLKHILPPHAPAAYARLHSNMDRLKPVPLPGHATV